LTRGLWKQGISLYGSSDREPGGGGSSARGPESYERKVLGMGISLHGGSDGQPGVGSSTRDFETWLKGALEVESVSLTVEALRWEPGSGDGHLFP